MKHVNLLLLASSLMLSCPALAQEYKQVWSDEFDNLEDKNWNFEEGTRDQGFGNWKSIIRPTPLSAWLPTVKASRLSSPPSAT